VKSSYPYVRLSKVEEKVESGVRNKKKSIFFVKSSPEAIVHLVQKA